MAQFAALMEDDEPQRPEREATTADLMAWLRGGR